jgi:hypothetical protein
MWSIAKRSTLTIAQLDGLFALPSVSSIISHPRLLLFVEVPFLIVVILALPLITIFAPAAMVTSLANPTTTNVSVPTIDLRNIQPIVIPWATSPPSLTPSADFLRPIQKATDASTPVSWPAPPPTGCSVSCNYTMTYTAPSLTCRDLRNDQIWVLTGAPGETLIPPPGTLIGLDIGFAYNMTAVNGTMTLVWVPNNGSYWNPQGVTCTFFNATYRASISYLNGSQSLWTEAISTGERLDIDVPEDFNTDEEPDNNIVFVEAFMSSFNTTYVGFSNGIQNFFPPLFVGDGMMLALRPDLSSLSQGLTSLTGNVTLSLIQFSNTTAFVELYSQSDRRLYGVRAFPLALTYGVAFFLSVVAITLGMQALLSSRTFRPVSFSQFLLTTHNPDIDQWMEGRSRLGALTLTDEELATRMTFDGTSFQPIWETKEKNESGNGEERNDVHDYLHADGSTHGEQSVGDHDHLDSDQLRGSVATDQNEGAEDDDSTPATAVNLTPHSSQSEL